MRTLVLTAVALSLLGAAPPLAAQPGAYAAATDFSAAKKRKGTPQAAAVPRYRHGPGTIACTRGGCQTVPPGCHAIRERTIDDSPSGFQIIIC